MVLLAVAKQGLRVEQVPQREESIRAHQRWRVVHRLLAVLVIEHPFTDDALLPIGRHHLNAIGSILGTPPPDLNVLTMQPVQVIVNGRKCVFMGSL